jgi:glycosyltransferase involved in cell wall biosynthesis
MIAFFHQNPVAGQQGGVERYIATLAHYGQGKCMLVLGDEDRTYVADDVVHVRMRGPSSLPRWSRFVAGILAELALVRKELAQRGVNLIEFSRPELLALAPLLKGKKIVTMHGTGPDRSSKSKYMIHHAFSALVPLTTHRVHVIGRDCSALPQWLQDIVASKIVHIDAWYDDTFKSSPHSPVPPLKIFYAGRLNAQKNPDLLVEVIRSAKDRFGRLVDFVYAGNDYVEIEKRGGQDLVRNLGLMNAEKLSILIQDCHAGILCSGYGEGSPFIIAEALACGRVFIMSPLRTLVETYSQQLGVIIAHDWTVDAYLEAIQRAIDLMSCPESYKDIAQGISQQRASRAVPRLLNTLVRLDN